MRDERAKQGKLFENDSGGNAMDALQPSTLTHFFRILECYHFKKYFKKMSNERIYCELPEGEPKVFPIPLDEILRDRVELDKGAPFHIPG